MDVNLLAMQVFELLRQGKVTEALSMEVTCPHCSKKFLVGQGAIVFKKKILS